MQIVKASLDTSFWNIARQIGLEQENLELALRAYQQGKVDLRGGALMAGKSYNAFLQAVQANRIVILESAGFLSRLQNLAEMFGDETLRLTINEVSAQLAP